jgi:hypothetical protein
MVAFALYSVALGCLPAVWWRSGQPKDAGDMVPREKCDALVRDFGSAEDEVKRLLKQEGAE